MESKYRLVLSSTAGLNITDPEWVSRDYDTIDEAMMAGGHIAVSQAGRWHFGLVEEGKPKGWLIWAACHMKPDGSIWWVK